MGSELYDFATGGSAMLPLTGTLGAGLAERRPIQQPETATAAAAPATAAAPQAPEAALQAAPPPPGAMPFALPLPPPLPAAAPPQPQQPIVAPAPVPVPVPVPAPNPPQAAPPGAQAPAQPAAKAAWLALPEAQRLGLIGWLGSPYQPVEMQAAARVLAEVAENAAPDLQGAREMAAVLSDIAARLAAKVGG